MEAEDDEVNWDYYFAGKLEVERWLKSLDGMVYLYVMEYLTNKNKNGEKDAG